MTFRQTAARIAGFTAALILSTQLVLAQNPVVAFETTAGNFKVELNPEKAPITVENFLRYVNEGYYNDTLFHRVIEDFMIQGGGYNSEFQQKTTYDPIRIESDNGLKNKAGTIAMARTGDPNSATSQFFINTISNSFLNYQNDRNPGYAVFGKVIEGMEVVENISYVDTGAGGPYKRMADVPVEPVIIVKAFVVEAEPAPAE